MGVCHAPCSGDSERKVAGSLQRRLRTLRALIPTFVSKSPVPEPRPVSFAGREAGEFVAAGTWSALGMA